MRRNPHWYGPQPVFERANFRVISTDSSRVAALLAGDVQAIDELPCTTSRGSGVTRR
jgi:peptide/nickel transport system substrate-binding protein